MVTKHPNAIQVPGWLKRYLDVKSIAAIEQAVADAEITTEGEIVPVIVRRSTHEFYPILLLQLIYGFLCLMAYELWHRDSWVPFSDKALMAAGVFGMVVVYFFSKTPWAKLLFLSYGELSALVEQRAAVEFISTGAGKTKGQTGVVLLVSIEDRRAVVLGDRAIAQTVSQQEWDQTVSYIIDGMKQKNLGDGLIKAIKSCGALLAARFPASSPQNDNEISNALVIRE